jgi:hypothetical protein
MEKDGTLLTLQMTPSQSKINTSTLSRICLVGSESFRTLAFKLDVDVNVRCCCRGTNAARLPAGANAEAERAATKRAATTELENFMVMVWGIKLQGIY